MSCLVKLYHWNPAYKNDSGLYIIYIYMIWTYINDILPLWAHGSMHFQNHEHHLGSIRAPTCQCSLSVTNISAEGGRLVKGWVLVNWAVKISNVSSLFKRQNGSCTEATTKTQEGCHDVCRSEIIHYCMLSLQEKYFPFFLITIWNDLAVRGTNYFT